MNQFWLWMKSKGYSAKYHKFINTGGGGHCTPTNHMLIGYMIEYLKEPKFYWIDNDQILNPLEYVDISDFFDDVFKLVESVSDIDESLEDYEKVVKMYDNLKILED